MIGVLKGIGIWVAAMALSVVVGSLATIPLLGLLHDGSATSVAVLFGGITFACVLLLRPSQRTATRTAVVLAAATSGFLLVVSFSDMQIHRSLADAREWLRSLAGVATASLVVFVQWAVIRPYLRKDQAATR